MQDTESFKSYLTNFSSHLQRIKLNANFSSCRKLLLRLPQGSALGPLLFNIILTTYFIQQI